MQPQRLAQAERALSGIAKRVLEAVPISEPWTVGQICTELRRNATRVDMAVVMGCLRTHVGLGLVREPTQLNFIRVQVPPLDARPLRIVHDITNNPGGFMSLPAHVAKGIADSHTPERLTEREPLHDIGALSQRLRESGRALIMWAEDLERLALEFEGRIDDAKKGNEQLAQLRKLLQNLGV